MLVVPSFFCFGIRGLVFQFFGAHCRVLCWAGGTFGLPLVDVYGDMQQRTAELHGVTEGGL